MSISLSSSAASVPLDSRAVLARASSSASLLQSKGGVVNDIVVPSVSEDVANAASADSATQSGFTDGVKKKGGPPGGGGQSSNTLDALIEAAKRKVQPLVGASGADQVVGKDGSIDYKKLADLISAQEAQGQQAQALATSATVLDLVA